MTFHNRSLAQELWGTDKNGDTWENIYLVEDVRNINIPYEILNPVLEYREKKFIQGFTVLNPEKSEKLNLKFDLFSQDIHETIFNQNYRDSVVKLDDGMDLNVEEMCAAGRKGLICMKEAIFTFRMDLSE